MGKDTGFLEYERKNNTDIPPAERIKNFEEFHKPLDTEKRRQQASRCMNCGVPFCQSAMSLGGMVTGCPLHNLIPEWNDELYRGHEEHSFARLHKTSNFPEFTGRVCPALCEKACMCGQHGDAVTVHDNELYLVETAYEKGYIKPFIPKIRSGKKVAVVGSGPSGLAVADELNHRGHTVEVFEREDEIGGLLMYGIPNMKLDKNVIKRRRRLMEAEGVVFHTGVNVGKDKKSSEILAGFDAVVLCCGAKKERQLTVSGGVKGEANGTVKGDAKGAGKGDTKGCVVDPCSIKGVFYAVDFLTSTTKALMKASDKVAKFDNNASDGYSRTSDGCDRPSDGCDRTYYEAINRNYMINRSSKYRTVDSLKSQGGYIDAAGKNVVIVGGGDTGNDCIGTVIRHGAKSVTALEMMPKPPVERAAGNPWPEWPKVLKTDYGHEEAIHVFGSDPRIFETTVKSIETDKKGALKQIETVKVTFKDGKLSEVPGTEKKIKCELLLIAAGFIGCEDYSADAFSLKKTQRGTVLTPDGSYHIEGTKIFSAGDMRRGQSLVVWAIAEGRACAKEVDEYLMGYTN